VKDKLILILSFTTVFALGCATASVLVANAEAETPAAGQEQCAGFLLGQPVSLQKPDKVDAAITEHARILPPGWHAVGGSSTGTPSALVIACRTGT
jgi:hypothetical protein